MSADVHATDGARRYHATPDCRALHAAQDLADWECPHDYCTHRHPRPRPVRQTPLSDALAAGKQPCRICYPHPVTLPPREDFGHRRVVSTLDGRTLEYVCDRCTVIKRVPGLWWHAPVRWPCTSAIVLGLYPRKWLGTWRTA